MHEDKELQPHRAPLGQSYIFGVCIETKPKTSIQFHSHQVCFLIFSAIAMARPDFDALKDMHDSANDLLHSPVIRRALVHHHQEKWVEEISEASLRMLDVCGTTRDVLLHVKDHIQDLRSTFRRASSTVGVPVADQEKFATYHLHRKKLRKDMLKRLHSLKGINNDRCIASEPLPIDHNLMAVVNVLREVRGAATSIVESLMSLMSMPKPSQTRKPAAGRVSVVSFTSKLMRVNSLSAWENCDAAALHGAYKRLEAVEMAVDDLGIELSN